MPIRFIAIMGLEDEVNDVWNNVLDFYRLKTEMRPKLAVLEDDEYGTRDKSVCQSSVILTYCRSRLVDELKLVGHKKKNFNVLRAYAFAECLAMGAQKILMSRKCGRKCEGCRAFNKSMNFKLLNYVVTYYVADRVVSKMFGVERFGSDNILKRLNTKPAGIVARALENVYARNDPDDFVRNISKRGDVTFSDAFGSLQARRADRFFI